MIAYHDDVSAGIVGGVHRFGRTDSSADDKRDGSDCTHGFDDVRRDRTDGSGTRLQIDRFLSHQFGSDTSVYDGVYVRRIKGLGLRNAHRRSLHSSVNQDVRRWDEIHL